MSLRPKATKEEIQEVKESLRVKNSNPQDFKTNEREIVIPNENFEDDEEDEDLENEIQEEEKINVPQINLSKNELIDIIQGNLLRTSQIVEYLKNS